MLRNSLLTLPFKLFSLLLFFVFGVASSLLCQVETLWSYGGDIGIHNLAEYVNIDGDEHLDQLILEKANNEIKYLAWQRNTANRIGIMRMIDLPSWPVWSCGVIDIDQDNDGDLLMTHLTTGDLYVCYQVCPSEFEEPVQLENITAQYGGFKNHDANGDGIEDLVGASLNEPFKYYMQHGLGDGEFGPLRKLHIGWTEIFARRFQDLDSDGYTDITVTTGSGSRIVYYPGQEDGGWGSEHTVITGISAPWASAIGDIDGDGHKDVIVANFNGNNQPVFIAHNNGDNTFEKQTLFASLLATTLLQCADLNNDGKSEILLGGANGGDVWIYQNKGNYTFTKTKLEDMHRASGDFSDYNNDGILDIVLRDISFYPERFYWWKGNVNGTLFEPMNAFTPVNGTFPNATIANFNEDPIPDELIIKNSLGNQDIYLAEGYGDGRFKQEQFITTFPGASSIRIIDQNRDGRHDLITNLAGQLFNHRNTGNGHLASPILLAENIGTFLITDTKRDGYHDFLYLKRNTDTLMLLSFEKTGPPTTFVFGATPPYAAFFVYDFNGDAFPDFAVTSNVTDQMDVYLNRLHSFEKVYSSTQFTGVFRDVKAMDFDWDGIRDILLLQTNSLYWIKGGADGTYGNLQLIPITGKIFEFTLLDVADDEREEVVITSSETANGYYTIKSPGTISNRKSLYTYHDRIGQFADINLDHQVDGAAQEYDSTLVWFVTHAERDYPYVQTTSPCNSGALVKCTVIHGCTADFIIHWDDGTVGYQHPGLTEGSHQYYVVQENDTVETVSITIHIDPLRIAQLDITPDEGIERGAFAIDIQGGLPPYAVSWRSAGATIGNLQTQLPAGFYLVNITDAKGCSLDTLIEISSLSTIPVVSDHDFISIYPSPARDMLMVQNKADLVELISIIQPDGKVMPQNSQLVHGQVITLDISACAMGVLFLQYKMGNAVYTEKFLRMK